MLHDDGWLSLKCWVGCSREEILRAADCELKDLGPPRPERVERFGKSIIDKVYTYVDEAGSTLFQVVRFRPKDFRQRQPDGKGGYIWSLTNCRKVLYRLDELTKKQDKVVFLVEGEKDVDNLRKLGFLATCNPLGAGKWTDEYSEMLRGRAVVLIPDHDPVEPKTQRRPGWEHVKLLTKHLLKVAQWVRIIQLNIPEGQDVSDWIEAGGTADELKRLVTITPNISHPEALPGYKPYGSVETPLPNLGRRVRKVRLTAEELSSAAHKGTMRHIWAIKKKDRSHDLYSAWSDKVELACAEQAAKKATHRYFVGAVGTYQDNLEEKLLHVKYHPTENQYVTFTESDGDEDLFVFVTGMAPCYSVHGWIRGKEAKLGERKDKQGAYLVPTVALKDVRELPPELDVESWDE